MYTGRSILVTRSTGLGITFFAATNAHKNSRNDGHVKDNRNDGRGAAPFLRHWVNHRNGFRSQDEWWKLAGEQEGTDVAGDRLPRRFIHNLVKEPGFLPCLNPMI